MAIEFSELKVGDQARVVSCDAEGGQQALRLMSMGVVPGTTLKVVRVAPLGDPIEIRVRGFHLSLRREEAKGIQVEHVG